MLGLERSDQLCIFDLQQRIEKLRADREEVRKMTTAAGIIPDVVEDVADAVLSDFNLHFDGLR
jgi:hypothetical protein